MNCEPEPVSDGNMDPFHVRRKLLGVADLILQHLSGAQMMSAMEVSTGWCSLIEDSEQFLGKIEFTVDGKTMQSYKEPRKLQNLLRSQRKYVNAEIRLDTFAEIEIRHQILKKFAGSLIIKPKARQYPRQDEIAKSYVPEVEDAYHWRYFVQINNNETPKVIRFMHPMPSQFCAWNRRITEAHPQSGIIDD